ncbi:hypothetical protein Pint_22650 [Pistacia integerrima]|uniref:Uncharacterized protein n=1 Tax=Pistacia integerrima TaxID=434235 RepID=A0ACC0YIX5_9ROSI|nr:hypothetical protein Pint_22650 [Pistacia integerrima]
MYDLQFGDHDGTGSEVLLQHPLAVFCAKDVQIYIADSYNHKIKKLDPASKMVSTLAGTGKAAFKDGTALAAQQQVANGKAMPCYLLYGISDALKMRKLLIANANNSVIRYLDLNKKEPELLTLELKGVQPSAPKSKLPKGLRRRSFADTQTIVVDGGVSNEGNISIKISLPEEYPFSKEARSKFSFDVEPENSVAVDPLDGNLSPEGSAVLHFRRLSPSASTGRISCKFNCIAFNIDARGIKGVLVTINQPGSGLQPHCDTAGSWLKISGSSLRFSMYVVHSLDILKVLMDLLFG